MTDTERPPLDRSPLALSAATIISRDDISFESHNLAHHHACFVRAWHCFTAVLCRELRGGKKHVSTPRTIAVYIVYIATVLLLAVPSGDVSDVGLTDSLRSSAILCD